MAIIGETALGIFGSRDLLFASAEETPMHLWEEHRGVLLAVLVKQPEIMPNPILLVLRVLPFHDSQGLSTVPLFRFCFPTLY